MSMFVLTLRYMLLTSHIIKYKIIVHLVSQIFCMSLINCNCYSGFYRPSGHSLTPLFMNNTDSEMTVPFQSNSLHHLTLTQMASRAVSTELHATAITHLLS